MTSPVAAMTSPVAAFVFDTSLGNGEHTVDPTIPAPPPTIATATPGAQGIRKIVTPTDYKDRHTVKTEAFTAKRIVDHQKYNGAGLGQQKRIVEIRKSHETVNAPIKKSGAGGSYTWGGAMDVTDYQPVGTGGYTAVQTVAAPTIQNVSYSTPFTASVTSSTQFPSLGTVPVAAAAPAAWGQVPPGVFAAAAPVTVSATATAPAPPPPQFIENNVRAGVTLDAQHPRNMFASKPYKPPAQQQPAQLAIDWSGAGSTGFTSQLINTVVNPAHLGPYTQPRPGPPMSQIMARPDPVNYIPNKNVQPKTYQSAQLGRTQGIIQQPQQRR